MRSETSRAAVAILAVLAAGGATSSRSFEASSGRCIRPLPTVSRALPAPVIVTTGCGRFRLTEGATVAYLGPRILPVPRVAQGYWGDLTWYGFQRGQLLVGRGHRQLWHSRQRFTGTNPVNVGAVVLGARELAFTYVRSRRPLLYLAGYRSTERLVTRGETPLAFLGSGEFVTWRDRSRALILRGAGGRIKRLLVRHASDVALDRQDGALVFRAGDHLGVIEGSRVEGLGSLRGLGVKGWPAIEPLGGLVAVHDRNRLVVIDYTGHLVASTALPGRQQPSDAISSSVVANATGTAFAFTATRGNTAHGSSGQETLYLLGAGEQQARPIFNEQLDFEVCERMADLAWHGRWLLYSTTEGRAAVVDSSVEATSTDLSRLVARLPGARSDGEGFFEVSWARR
jgi:hypothetical protein